MSYSPYLLSVARALKQQVHPGVEDARARDVLEACIRAIAGMAVSLDDALPDELNALQLPADIGAENMPFQLSEPPENVALTPRTGQAIAAGADWLSGGGWLLPERLDDARRMVGWERHLIADRVERMLEIESQSADDSGLKQLLLDPTALEHYFAARCGPRAKARVTDFRQAIGGRSRQTAVFTLEGETGLPRKLVVQRDHPARISPHGIAQEYPLLELLSKTALKVARPLILETRSDILGAPFMVLEQCPGSLAGPDYFIPPQRPALAIALAKQLAILHGVDATPIEERLTRTTEPGQPDAWLRDLDRLEATWNQFKHGPSMTVSAALAWMRAHVHLIGDETAIIHNDAVFHNILIEGDDIVALLDWELAHLGHPAEDLGYCRPFIQEMGDWQRFTEAYADAGGKRFSPQVLDYFSLRASIYLMTLIQYGRGMFKSGATSDINLAEVATSFMPKLLRRTANILDAVLEAGTNGSDGR